MSRAQAAKNTGRMALTYHEAAERLALCERTVWGLVRCGKLKAARIGRSVRIPVSEIERFLSESVQAADA